jgi:hypothetical protein
MPSIARTTRAGVVVGLSVLLCLIPTASTLAGGAAGPWPW